MEDETSVKRLRKALDGLVYGPLRVETSPSTSTQPSAKGQTWDRRMLYERLQTFKAATWFAKPEAISPQECALRGWRNVGPDTLACEFCSGQAYCPAPPDADPADVSALGHRYAGQLTTSHEEGCPWRTASCSPDLLACPVNSKARVKVASSRRVPSQALEQGSTCRSLAPYVQEGLEREWLERMGRVQRLARLPPLSPGAIAELDAPGPEPGAVTLAAFLAAQGLVTAPAGPQDLAAMLGVASEPALHGSAKHALRAAALALAGWDAEPLAGCGGPDRSPSSTPQPFYLPEHTRLRCGMCAASVGAWSFFPELVTAGSARHQRPPDLRGGDTHPAGPAGPGPQTGSGTTTIAGGLLAETEPRPDTAQVLENHTSAVQEEPSAAEPLPAAGPFGKKSELPLFGSPLAVHRQEEKPLQSERRPDANPHRPAVTIAGGGLDDGGHARAQPGRGEARPAVVWAASSPPFGFASLAERVRAQGRHPAASGGANGGRAKRARECLAVATDTPTPQQSQTEHGNAQQPAACSGLPAGLNEATSPVWYLSASALGRYAELDVREVDCLHLHRTFCPWVNDRRGAAGWRAVLGRADEGDGALTSPRYGAAAKGDWNPVGLLQAVLSKVDVKL